MIATKIILIISFIAPVAILTYPLISFIRYTFFSKPIDKSEQFVAPVSIIISCYNEENFIRNKIVSFLDKDEWIEGSEIIVVSTGSNDKTNSILSEFQNNTSINVIITQERLSKIMAVNLAVDHAKHNILVFSDCRQIMKKGSLKQLVHNFNDETIGTVVSILNDPDDQNKQSFFRSTINRLVFYDSQSGSGLNVYGALYAQWKSVFRKFPEDQLFDDLCVITTTLSQKKRLIQEPRAVIYDVTFQSYYAGERLERLTRGLLLFITKQWSELMKISKWDLFRFLCFKYAKLIVPFSFIIWVVYFGFYVYTSNNVWLIVSILLIALILLVFKKSRALLTLGFRINIHFFWAIFKFFFLRKQSVRWEKLKIKK